MVSTTVHQENVQEASRYAAGNCLSIQERFLLLQLLPADRLLMHQILACGLPALSPF